MTALFLISAQTSDRSPTGSSRIAFPWEIDPPPQSLVPLDEIRSGGPPPDGIPPIDEPKFESVDEAEAWLDDREPVLSLVRDEAARAYPLQILTWHEIVNDTFAGDPITVTYCPLCNSGIAFHRRSEPTGAARSLLGAKDPVVLDFGTSGRLYRSNLVMYDRQTKSLWIQFTGQAVTGPFMGAELETIPSQMVSWAEFREAHADASVLSRDTGHRRDYGRNPYAGYDDVGSTPFLFDGEHDGRLDPMERVVTVSVDGASRAYRYRSMNEMAQHGAAVISDVLADTPIAIFYRFGTTSALDASEIAASKDVGAAGVFDARIAGRRLTFEPSPEGFRDNQTGSTWNLLGEAVSGELEGSRLEAVVHDDTFWFVWSTFRPQTTIWKG
ncbi:MAG: DUF3179 domain-containing protein [Actinomycetota bacterium]